MQKKNEKEENVKEDTTPSVPPSDTPKKEEVQKKSPSPKEAAGKKEVADKKGALDIQASKKEAAEEPKPEIAESKEEPRSEEAKALDKKGTAEQPRKKQAGEKGKPRAGGDKSRGEEKGKREKGGGKSRAQAKESSKGGDLEEKVLFVNRCSKVVKGGRKFSFSALILVGNSAGNVGYGFAKANQLADAIRKGGELARRNLVTFEMEGSTIPHEVFIKYDGARLLLKPAAPGTGIVAGSQVRSVLELAGIHDVVAKNLGSSNPVNQVLAVFKAFHELRSRKDFLEARGIECSV